MTVIAYRDGVMASDSAVFIGTLLAGSTRKIMRAPDGALGGACGPSACTGRFRSWMAGSREHAFDSGDPDFGAILVEPGGVVWMIDGRSEAFRLDGPFHAQGVGIQCAMAAMEMGASAEDAVRAAIKHNAYCAGEVQVERVGLKRAARKAA